MFHKIVFDYEIVLFHKNVTINFFKKKRRQLMNKIKRWYYELTEKQIIMFAKIVAIIVILLGVINFFLTYLHGRLPKGDDFFLYILSLCSLPFYLPLLFIVYYGFYA